MVVRPDLSVHAAVELLVDMRLKALPVVDADRKCVGIHYSERPRIACEGCRYASAFCRCCRRKSGRVGSTAPRLSLRPRNDQESRHRGREREAVGGHTTSMNHRRRKASAGPRRPGVPRRHAFPHRCAEGDRCDERIGSGIGRPRDRRLRAALRPRYRGSRRLQPERGRFDQGRIDGLVAHGLQRAAIVDKDGTLVGLVSDELLVRAIGGRGAKASAVREASEGRGSTPGRSRAS